MTQQPPPAFDAIILHDRDNVATALHDLAPGVDASIRAPNGELAIKVREAIPACHKLSLEAIEMGSQLYKHGMFIGYATALIEPGTHVHVHNLAGRTSEQKKSSTA